MCRRWCGAGSGAAFAVEQGRAPLPGLRTGDARTGGHSGQLCDLAARRRRRPQGRADLGHSGRARPLRARRNLPVWRSDRAVHRSGQRDRGANCRLMRSPTTSNRRAASPANSARCRLSISPSRAVAMNAAASALPAHSRNRRCRSPAGIAAPGDEIVDRAALACVLDRLTMLSAGGDSSLDAMFARAEIKRTFCGRRDPILAATSGHTGSIAGRHGRNLRHIGLRETIWLR